MQDKANKAKESIKNLSAMQKVKLCKANHSLQDSHKKATKHLVGNAPGYCLFFLSLSQKQKHLIGVAPPLNLAQPSTSLLSSSLSRSLPLAVGGDRAVGGTRPRARHARNTQAVRTAGAAKLALSDAPPSLSPPYPWQSWGLATVAVVA